MFLVPKDLRIVVLDYPYYGLANPETQRLFGKLMAMKIAAFSAAYPDGVMPVDTYDFIATHFLACSREGNGTDWRPLAAYRVVPLERCERHRLAFPPLGVLRDASSDTSRHLRAVEAILSDCKRRGVRLEYSSSWATNPALQGQSELRKFLKELMMSLHLLRIEHDGRTEHMTAGAPRMRTDEAFQWLGFEPLKEGGEELPLFVQRSLGGEPARMFHGRLPAARTEAMRSRFSGLWNERVELPATQPAVASAEEAADGAGARKAA